MSLCAAVPDARWLAHIPQLDELTTSRLQIDASHALAPDAPGLGIAWDFERLAALRKFEPIVL